MTGRPAEQTVHWPDTRRRGLDEPPRPRPLLLPALAFMAGIWLSETVGVTTGPLRWLATWLPLVLLAGLLVGRRFVGQYRHAAAGLLLMAAFGVGFLRHQAAVGQPANHVAHVLSDEPILTRLAGEVVSTPVTRPTERRNPFIPFDPPPRTRLVLAVSELRTTDPPTPISGRIRVTVEGKQLGLRLGQRVELTGKLYRPRPPQNPGEFDWARWNYLQGIDAGMAVEGSAYVRRVVGEGAPLRRLVSAIRGLAHMLLLEPYADVGSEEAARLLDTMVLGQRGAAGRELNEAFLRAGGMHFLAVSGFHVGVLAVATWWLVRRLLRRGSTISAIATLAVILLYALVAEPNAPILRAATLGGLAMLAVLSRRPVSILNWLALAAICILACNPLELFRPGFQLSFVQVAGLVTIVPTVYRVARVGRRDDEPPTEASTYWQWGLRWLWRSLLGLTIVCVVAWVIALPLVSLHFGRFAPWGALGTFLLSVPVTITIWLSFLTLVSNLLLPPAGLALGAALEWTTEGLLRLVSLFERFPAAVIEVSSPPAWLVLVTYAALLYVFSRVRTWADSTPDDRPAPSAGRRAPRASLVAAGVLVVAWVGWGLWPTGASGAGCCIQVLSVGNGSATLLTTADGRAAFFDVGTDRNIDAGETAAGALRALGIGRLDTVCISHANFDHYSGVPTLLRVLPVGRLLWNQYFETARYDNLAVSQFFELLPPEETAKETLSAGDRLVFDDVWIEVLWPPAKLDRAAWAANDRSLVMRLHASGRTVLLTGDIESAAIRELLAADASGEICLAADVLIAPHHGSVLRRDTAAFYAAADPELVLVSSGRPRPKLAALLRGVLGPQCRLVSTRDVGTLTVRIPPDGEIVLETPFRRGAAPAPQGAGHPPGGS